MNKQAKKYKRKRGRQTEKEREKGRETDRQGDRDGSDREIQTDRKTKLKKNIIITVKINQTKILTVKDTDVIEIQRMLDCIPQAQGLDVALKHGQDNVILKLFITNTHTHCYMSCHQPLQHQS